MRDPVEDQLRSFYSSIQRDPPPRLEGSVVRAMDATPRRAPFGFARPAFAVLAAGAAVIVLAVALRGMIPNPSPSGSPVAGSSATPTATATPTASLQPTIVPSSGCSIVPSAAQGCGAVPTASYTSAQTNEPSPTARPVGSLQDTGAMNPALSQPVAVRLADGRVLITGGREKRSNGITVLRSQAVEIYEAAPGKFTPTGSMADARAGHTATLLNDGRVLVVGGIDASDGFDNLATAEIYDPDTGKFTRTGSLAQGRAHHTATLLKDGRVLIAGGYGGGTLSLKSAEIYDPATGRFTATGSMTVARRDATATLLTSGLVLVAGGLDQYATSALASAELYDPATGKFTATGSMAAARSSFASMGLEDGRILVGGGKNTASSALKSVEAYDPGTGKFSPAGSMTAAGAFTAVWLKDTRVLFVASGGLSLYDPAVGTFSPVGAPAGPVDTATFTLGNVLLTEGGPAQVYQP
jgi:hypothetical protein